MRLDRCRPFSYGIVSWRWRGPRSDDEAAGSRGDERPRRYVSGLLGKASLQLGGFINQLRSGVVGPEAFPAAGAGAEPRCGVFARGSFVAGVAVRGSRCGIGLRGSYVPDTEARVQSTSDCEGHPAGNAGRSTWPNPTCRNMHSIDSVTPEAPFRGRFVHDLQSVTPGGDTPRSYGAGSGPVWHVRCSEEQGGTVRAQPLGANRPRRAVTNPSASETSGSTQHAGRGSAAAPACKTRRRHGPEEPRRRRYKPQNGTGRQPNETNALSVPEIRYARSGAPSDTPPR